MLRALNKLKQKKNCVYRVLVVREESKGMKFKHFKTFHRDGNEQTNLEEMRAKISQLHNLKEAVLSHTYEKEEFNKKDSDKFGSMESCPFVLDVSEEIDVSSEAKNIKFINNVKKRFIRPNNFKLTSFGCVRKDDDADRVITDDPQTKMRQNENLENKQEPLKGYINQEKSHDNAKIVERGTSKTDNLEDPVNAFDQEYFNLSDLSNQTEEVVVEGQGEGKEKREGRKIAGEEVPVNPPSIMHRDEGGLGFFEEQYFDSAGEIKKIEDVQGNGILGKLTLNKDEIKIGKNKDMKENYTKYVENNITKDVKKKINEDMKKYDKTDLKSDKEDKEMTKVTRRQSEKAANKANFEEPQTAYDAVMVIRKKKMEGVSNRSISQVPDIANMLDHEVVSLLCHSILFENDDIIAINKPYGLACHGGPGIYKSVSSLTSELAKRRRKKPSSSQSSSSQSSSSQSSSSQSSSQSSQSSSQSSQSSSPEYHVVHRLDKETTGVMLLAKSAQMAEILRSKFKRRKITKVYWAVLKGVPNPPEGVIDIAVKEGMVGDRYRMVLNAKGGEISDARETGVGRRRGEREEERDGGRDVERGNNREGGSGMQAVTNYKVLDQHGNASLVECTPESGVKHQIRCHMANALNTPILGDHKYSHFSKMAPQRLSSDVLQRLGLRQAQVRRLNMHLHAKSLIIPEFLPNGQNLHITSRLPPHFVSTLKALKLSPPK